MAVTILERPEGHVLSSTENTATVSESYGTGDASFVDINHGLSDGDYIYAVSTIESHYTRPRFDVGCSVGCELRRSGEWVKGNKRIFFIPHYVEVRSAGIGELNIGS